MGPSDIREDGQWVEDVERTACAWLAIFGEISVLDVPVRPVLVQDAMNVQMAGQDGLERKSRLEVLNMSLRGLLDYTEDDVAEATFEASMFGEMFLEMLQARFGRAILRTLPLVAEQVISNSRRGPDGSQCWS